LIAIVVRQAILPPAAFWSRVTDGEHDVYI
jgi:hypothetical protein